MLPGHKTPTTNQPATPIQTTLSTQPFPYMPYSTAHILDIGHSAILVHGAVLLILHPGNTCKVISGRALTCDGAHSWRLHNGVPLADHATGTITLFHTQSYYPDTEQTTPCAEPRAK